ncbi:MAG: glucans biosynthesis glucosyltransferase MdoH [Verrucomicrobiales bacterium]|nr:glucans biosynthesis glucosyltransferase MdoH [Verrucomicrobiales bacterium]
MKTESHDSGWKMYLFFSIVLGITAIGSYLMADYLWRFGMEPLLVGLWIVFTILFGYLAFGFTHAATGFFIRRLGVRSAGLPPSPDLESTSKSSRKPRIAVTLPVYNEPVDRVFAGLRAIFESTVSVPGGDMFDFFVLSDSNQPEQWLAEEAAWARLTRECNGIDRIFYRRRPGNTGKKSGNIADFCRTWGKHYDYMIVLDADSIMTGKTFLHLVGMMEKNPRVALIQTAPRLVGGESLFGRIQQFSNRLYGEVFMEGLAFWQESGGNFWGHNAIIRMKPFIRQCDLPKLPGKSPFGGHILSHDFVEAGLLRRVGWEVWMAHKLEGTYEEGPQGIVESAVRDRRWCQGNLQHGMLLFARGFRGRTRVHLANGILGYVSSPLWLLFMILSAFAIGSNEDLLSAAPNGGAALLAMTAVLLFGPKILCLIDLLVDRKRTAQFGGASNAICSVILETVFSALLAPVMMLFHTRFVLTNLIGKTVDWSPQQRGASGTTLDEALAVHGWQTLAGILVGTVVALVNTTLFLWLIPVLLGLWLAVPVSVFTSLAGPGLAARKEKLFVTPEEICPPAEVAAALAPVEIPPGRFRGVVASVLDPFLNAVHVSLLRRNRRRLIQGNRENVYCADDVKSAPSKGAPSLQIRELAERFLSFGPGSLSQDEVMSLLSDIDNMLWLHREAWLRPASRLGAEWNDAIRMQRASL